MRGVGEEHLPAMRGREDASYPVDRLAEVVPISLFGDAGMQRHPHLYQSYLRRPCLGHEHMLHVEGSGQGAMGSRESGTECIAHGLEYIAAAALLWQSEG